MQWYATLCFYCSLLLYMLWVTNDGPEINFWIGKLLKQRHTVTLPSDINESCVIQGSSGDNLGICISLKSANCRNLYHFQWTLMTFLIETITASDATLYWGLYCSFLRWVTLSREWHLLETMELFSMDFTASSSQRRRKRWKKKVKHKQGIWSHRWKNISKTRKATEDRGFKIKHPRSPAVLLI